MLNAHNHQDQSLPTVIQGMGSLEGNRLPLQTLGVSATILDKPSKPIVSQSFTKSQNNRTHAVNDAKIYRPHQSSAQVS
jgi:hypothetical protein